MATQLGSPDVRSCTVIEDTLALLKKDSLVHAFSSQFLRALPSRCLAFSTVTQWVDFLQDRFAFFDAQATGDIRHGIYRLSATNDTDATKRTVLEVICPDANYIVITLEALFRDYNFAITKLFHPIISATIKRHKLTQIDRADKDAALISYIYIEFDSRADAASLLSFEKRLALHLSSIQFACQDQSKILETLEQIKPKVLNGMFRLNEPQTEWANLLDWLKSGNFSFYGYIRSSEDAKHAVHYANGLGILSADCLSIKNTPLLDILKDHNRTQFSISDQFQFDTISFTSPVQRFENLMRLSLKIPDSKGLVEEHVILGLLKRSSLLVKNIETPIIHLKMHSIFKSRDMIPGSYDHTEVIRIFTSIPKFELFRLSSQALLQMVDDLLSITNPNRVYCFSRSAPNRLSLLIVIPHASFSGPNISTIAHYIQRLVPHTSCEIIEIRGDEKCRLHVHFGIDKPVNLDCATIETDIHALIKPWADSLKDVLFQAYPGEKGAALFTKYEHAFPNHYQVIRDSESTLRDIRFIEAVEQASDVQLNLVPFHFSDSALSGKASILSIYSKKKIDLMTVMPVLQNLGLHVYDEITTGVGPQKEAYGYIHSFRVVDEDGRKIDDAAYLPLFSDIIQAIFSDRTLNDPLNRLILKAGLGWRDIQILQTYRNYQLQLSNVYTKEKLNMALLLYPMSTRLLHDYFEAKFIPKSGITLEKRKSSLVKIEKSFLESMIKVEDVADDLALKTLFNLMKATLRTNFYIPKPQFSTTISIKIDSHAVHLMPRPVPFREIFVYDVGVEGIHLRFGSVARGGLRWSDRPDDFRTEVLSLVKTQQVKNVVIVPVGSKGGFVLKRKLTNKDQIAAESVAQYRNFIGGLLDITDNVDASGKVKHPDHVVIYDEEDPYLVVAADKGTANFSDIANEISDHYEFWLGDAFASGGSVGYNHKKEAITARGAWECTTLHFKELGKNITTDPFTVAGIGDMSGDVFGNGLLMSDKIKLQAAFNHVHIFLDPSPDPAKSFKERKRLFDLPRSSWQDYTKTLISKGGGIFERKAKEITLAEEAQKLLGLKKSIVNGEELIRAILKMNVDLLWFGGIGTYIKSVEETHQQVGDPANDSVRIESGDCRASVITEGANLGVTQRARIELFRHGARINTDAIDNSAGVNMSDYEVNIKILLKRMLLDAELTSVAERNALLEKATDQVSELVLENNRGQHQLISMDVMRSSKQFQLFSNLIQTYVEHGIIDAKTENLPSGAELDHLAQSKQPISRPVLAVIQAYVKMEVYGPLVSDAILLEPYFYEVYRSYFPKVFLDRFGDLIQKHHLKQQILATLLTNQIVNQAGSTFYFHINQITGKSVGEITKAYLIAEHMIEAHNLRHLLSKEAPNQEVLYLGYIKIEATLAQLTIALLQLPFKLSFDHVDQYIHMTTQFRIYISQKGPAKARINHWLHLGYSSTTSKSLAVLGQLDTTPDVLFLHHQEGVDVDTAGILAQAVTHGLHFDWIMAQLSTLELSNPDEIELCNSIMSSIAQKKIKLLRQLVSHGFNKRTELHTADHNRDIVKYFREAISGMDLYLKRIADLQNHNSAITLISLSVALSKLEL